MVFKLTPSHFGSWLVLNEIDLVWSVFCFLSFFFSMFNKEVKSQTLPTNVMNYLLLTQREMNKNTKHEKCKIHWRKMITVNKIVAIWLNLSLEFFDFFLCYQVLIHLHNNFKTLNSIFPLKWNNFFFEYWAKIMQLF